MEELILLPKYGFGV